MTLTDFATFSTAISGLAVTASLIYLALQTHQNAKHTRALIFQGAATRVSNLYVGMADADLVAAEIIGNGGVVTPEEVKRKQFFVLWQTHYVNWDDTYSQYEQGLLNAELFSRLRSALVYQLRVNPGFRPLYLDFVRHNAADSKFHKFIQEVVGEANAAVSRAA
jgi:hypothetical protein